jgi:hypothetical protein
MYSKTPLTSKIYSKKQYQKHNVKIKTFYKKGKKVASRPASRQQHASNANVVRVVLLVANS